MGDLSAEPSMEDILASIKRVIKEGEPPSQGRRLSPRPLPSHHETPAPRQPEVLELNEPMAAARAAPAPEPAPMDRFAEAAAHVGAPLPDPTAASAPDPAAVSAATVEATRGALSNLSRLIVKPDGDSDGTLEGMVREMLRPMLSDWLDHNLPTLVEQMVAREIARITAQG